MGGKLPWCWLEVEKIRASLYCLAMKTKREWVFSSVGLVSILALPLNPRSIIITRCLGVVGVFSFWAYSPSHLVEFNEFLLTFNGICSVTLSLSCFGAEVGI